MSWYYLPKATQQLQQQQQQVQTLQGETWQRTPTGPQTVASPMPPDPASSAYVAQQIGSSVYIQQGYNVEKSEYWQRTPQGPQTLATVYRITPPQPQSEIDEAAVAKALTAADVRASYQFTPKGGTAADINVPPTFGLTEQQKALYGETVQARRAERLINLSSFIVVPAATFSVGAAPVLTQAALGAGLSVGISQAGKAVTGGGLLTPSEFAEAGLVGAILAPVSTKAITALKLTAPTLPHIAGRVAVGAGLGAGTASTLEYVQTGQVTPFNVAVGAATGAAFIAVGEAIGVGAQKVAQKTVNKSYLETLETGELYKPNLTERALMKVTGVKPDSPEIKAKATEILDASYKKQYDINEAVLYDRVPEGTKTQKVGPWTPTPKEAEIMEYTGINPAPAPSVNVARVGAGGIDFAVKGSVGRAMAADMLWDFSFAPKTGVEIVNVAPTAAAAPKVRVPLFGYKFYFGAKGSWMAKTQTSTDVYSDDIYGVKRDLDRFEIQKNIKRPTEQELLARQIDTAAKQPLPDNLLEVSYPKDLTATVKASTKPIVTTGQEKTVLELKVKSVESQKNISTFEALQLAKKVAKQGKRTENIALAVSDDPIASWDNEWLVELSKPKVEMKSKTRLTPTTQQTGAYVASVEVQQPNPFNFRGKQYYPQKQAVEEAETVYLSYPKSGLATPNLLAKTKDEIKPASAAGTLLFAGELGKAVQKNPEVSLALNLGKEVGSNYKVQIEPKNALALQGKSTTAIGVIEDLVSGTNLKEVTKTTIEITPAAKTKVSGIVGLGEFKAPERPLGLARNRRPLGVSSRKVKYPILSGVEVAKMSAKMFKRPKKGG